MEILHKTLKFISSHSNKIRNSILLYCINKYLKRCIDNLMTQNISHVFSRKLVANFFKEDSTNNLQQKVSNEH